MTPPMVGERNSVKVKLGHEEAGNPREHKGPAAENQEILNEPCGHEKAQTNRSPPNPTQFLEQVEVGV